MSRHEGFELSKLEIQELTDWPDTLVEDYRSLVDSVNSLFTLVENSVVAGYFGGVQNKDIPNFNLSTGSYVTLPMESLSPLSSRGGSVNVSTNEFTFTAKGVWTVIINFNIEGFNSFNAGRNFNVRIFNVTKGTAGTGVIVGVGRNSEDVYFSSSFLGEITQANIDDGDVFRIELGAANTAITGGTLISTGIQFTHASELGLLL